MARLNYAIKSTPARNHEGAKASRVNPNEQLRRSVLSCLLWEDSFYEDGESIADRIQSTADKCSVENIAALAKEARDEYRLRHAPLWLSMALLRRGGNIAGDTLNAIIQRPDELTEALAMYWKDGKRPLSKQLKRGLAMAFTKFDEYQLAKYNRDDAIKLRDVLFMVHAKPKDEEQDALWKRLIDGQLAVPDTWEAKLSGGMDKAEAFTDLLKKKKLGYMALLRNLRNMTESGVERDLIVNALREGAEKSKALPFRYISAAIACPSLEPELDEAMMLAFKDLPKLHGTTVVLVDVSGSMGAEVSGRSKISRLDAAAGLAIYAREASDNCRVFAFGTNCSEVPARRGMALRDAIKSANLGHATNLFQSAKIVNDTVGTYDRMIVITDEQAHGWNGGSMPDPNGKGYILNVAPYENGVAYGPWTHINGWSEQSIRYINEIES